MKQYTNVAYTDEQMQEAKADRAKLRKFADALDNARKTVKSECLEPYERFEKKINELKELIAEPVNMIDAQVKEYEAIQRENKREECKKLFEKLKTPEEMAFHVVFNTKWLNVSYSMKQIEADIKAAIEQWTAEMSMIDRLTNPVPAKLIYIQTMDISKAIAESDRQDEIDRKKAEEEQRAKEAAARQYEESKQRIAEKAEADRAEIERRAKEEEARAKADAENKAVYSVEQPTRQWVSFKALISPEEAVMLKKFFDNNGIEFAPIA